MESTSNSEKTLALIQHIKEHNASGFIQSFNEMDIGDRIYVISEWKDTKTNDSLLFVAVKNNNFEIVERIIQEINNKMNDEEKAKIMNHTGSAGGNVLLISGASGNTRMSQILLENGVDPNTRNKWNVSAMFRAFSRGNLVVMKLCMKHGYNFSKAINIPFTGNRMTSLSHACSNGHLHCIKYLFQLEKQVKDEEKKHQQDNYNEPPFKIDMYSKSKRNMNALMYACSNNRVEVIQYLLNDQKFCQLDESNNVINECDNMTGNSAVHFCALAGSLESVKLLCEQKGCNVNRGNKLGNTPLHLASQNNHFECVEYFINTTTNNNDNDSDNELKCNFDEFNNDKHTPLMVAIKNNSHQSVYALANCEKVDIIKKNSKGNNALDIAAFYGNAIGLVILLQALIKKHKIDNYQQLVQLSILTKEKINHWFERAKIGSNSVNKHKTTKLEYLLSQLDDICSSKHNFELLLSLLNSYFSSSDSNDTTNQETILNKLTQFEKLKVICGNIINLCDKNALTIFVECINKMIENKMPVNDTLLMLSLKFNQEKFKKIFFESIKTSVEIENKNEIEEKQNMSSANINTISMYDNLSDKSQQTTHSKTGGSEKAISWFKMCVANSHILAEKDHSSDNNNKNGNNSDNNNNLLFDAINHEIMKKELRKQKEFIKASIVEIESEYKEFWKQIKEYNTYNLDKYQDIQQNKLINRFSKKNEMIEKGIKCEYSENELVNDYVSGFNGSEEYDKHSYLNELLINAAKINPQFQESCANIFNEKILGVKCVFKKSANKRKKRCIEKASLDYSDKTWPQSGFILDINRCCVILDNPQDLLIALNKFVSIVGKGENSGFNGVKKLKGNIVGVCRIKNMFNVIDNWSTIDDFDYCDIKMNVIIESNNVRMIGEIQFLLSFMVEAKKMSHKFYSFMRNDELYYKMNQIMQLKENDSHYAISQLKTIIATQNYDKLSHIVLFGQLDLVFEKIQDKNDKIKLFTQLVDLCAINEWKKGFNLINDSIKV